MTGCSSDGRARRGRQRATMQVYGVAPRQCRQVPLHRRPTEEPYVVDQTDVYGYIRRHQIRSVRDRFDASVALHGGIFSSRRKPRQAPEMSK